jgi:surface-anchored protein
MCNNIACAFKVRVVEAAWSLLLSHASFLCFRRFLMFTSRYLLRAVVATAALALVPCFRSASAQSIYTSGHADVGVGYDDIAEEFEPHWHTGVGAVVDGVSQGADAEFAPVDLIARTTATRTTPSGGGGLAGLLGVPDGTSIWVLGSTTYQPNLGFGTEELDPLDWTTPITITFDPLSSTMPSGTAQFGLYTTNLAGTSVVDRLFSTFDPLDTDFGNALDINAGDHAHFQWAFTELGQYDLSFTWSGIHALDGPISTTATFSVQAVPEPSTIAMLGIAGGVGAMAAVRRNRRRSASTPAN